jgi:hypothetical protein
MKGPGSNGNDGQSFGGALVDNSGFQNTGLIRNTIVAHNVAGLGVDAYGEFTSGGYNLIGDGAWAGGFSQTGDQTGGPGAAIDPKFDRFYYPPDSRIAVLTLASDSPARDRGKSFGLITDQRGGRRPIDFPTTANAVGGDNADIGSVEMGGLFRIVDIRRNGSAIKIRFVSEPGSIHGLQSKGNLRDISWTPIGSAVAGDGRVLELEDMRGIVAQQFYRVTIGP